MPVISKLPPEFQQRQGYAPSLMDLAPDSCFSISIYIEVNPQHRRRFNACKINKTRTDANLEGEDRTRLRPASDRIEESKGVGKERS